MRHFTPDEANAELERVRPLVEQLVARRREHVAALERQEELESKIRGNGGGMPPAELAAADAQVGELARGLASLAEEITALGVQVKDLDEGIVDFPALREGETGAPLLEARRGRDRVLASRRGRLRGSPPAPARRRLS